MTERGDGDPPSSSGMDVIETILNRASEIMGAAKNEFALAALLALLALGALIVGSWVAALLAGGAVVLGVLGHRRGMERERRELGAPVVDVPQLASEVQGSGPARDHWQVRRGDARRASAPGPTGIDPFDYLIYRHTRSAERPAVGDGLPPIRHFVDLRQAALVPEDCELLVDLMCSHIDAAFPDPGVYTGLLIPRTGNVALGLAVAARRGLEPVLVRDQPLFGRCTESALTAGLLLLIDDIWSDGAVLRRAVEMARFDNFSVGDGVVLVARTEGDLVLDLASSNLELKPYRTLGDQDLDRLLTDVATALRASAEDAERAVASRSRRGTPRRR